MTPEMMAKNVLLKYAAEEGEKAPRRNLATALGGAAGGIGGAVGGARIGGLWNAVRGVDDFYEALDRVKKRYPRANKVLTNPVMRPDNFRADRVRIDNIRSLFHRAANNAVKRNAYKRPLIAGLGGAAIGAGVLGTAGYLASRRNTQED